MGNLESSLKELKTDIMRRKNSSGSNSSSGDEAAKSTATRPSYVQTLNRHTTAHSDGHYDSEPFYSPKGNRRPGPHLRSAAAASTALSSSHHACYSLSRATGTACCECCLTDPTPPVMTKSCRTLERPSHGHQRSLSAAGVGPTPRSTWGGMTLPRNGDGIRLTLIILRLCIVFSYGINIETPITGSFCES
ncbi:hypothetical protein CAPTEDRAFT_216972 [Capitella teleta]|uniref:Uncharacterized protein n=1 Tax=Capitella teleta TaxID=283909 RepID=R7T4Y5_CAPTE|nr:hypothetical protein CAPTEDRAFT_216972 [Capitella teleta]|eukprot:ELT88182.1 hypothetical protein CAPTEDRAFT_216972 [Capitella teleta]